MALRLRRWWRRPGKCGLVWNPGRSDDQLIPGLASPIPVGGRGADPDDAVPGWAGTGPEGPTGLGRLVRGQRQLKTGHRARMVLAFWRAGRQFTSYGQIAGLALCPSEEVSDCSEAKFLKRCRDRVSKVSCSQPGQGLS